MSLSKMFWLGQRLAATTSVPKRAGYVRAMASGGMSDKEAERFRQRAAVDEQRSQWAQQQDSFRISAFGGRMVAETARNMLQVGAVYDLENGVPNDPRQTFDKGRQLCLQVSPWSRLVKDIKGTAKDIIKDTSKERDSWVGMAVDVNDLLRETGAALAYDHFAHMGHDMLSDQCQTYALAMSCVDDLAESSFFSLKQEATLQPCKFETRFSTTVCHQVRMARKRFQADLLTMA